ncbi:FHA domain-containing protein [Candidatus Synechococcus calcipolaris G9]|uniref:FHA domain-containing protein n=1 Tax=Candidatus Synechococcus calcipolaris G9 TaxID=1497997 RepID=A0ABT6EXG2_9SYNE|nr:FHA domain-containing protein [Candidatus Synechococcus calcipolaris]MDG2990490.1 FHA domain-containing protein [Candidatus Synechococcus calcipolaris G9]
MLNKIPEKYMHLVRWSLALGWLVLITSLFYDPISEALTDPASGSPFRLRGDCLSFQGECKEPIPYPMGARIFWGMVVPSVVVTLVTLSHEAWRRLCPLAFFSQIPRSLGWQRKRKITNPQTKKTRYELVAIEANSWLGRNRLYVQMGLLFLGLVVRLLFVNSDRWALGVFLIVVILLAIAVGFLYPGKSWCQYFCPMAPVQEIYTGPRGLLGSEAHQGGPQGITQSMCRSVTDKGTEKSVCVSCQSPCMDIDAERAYWDRVQQPERRLLYYGYLGLVIGFFLYFFFYTGNANFLGGTVWLERQQLSTLMGPGFYIGGTAWPIPKLVAVPLTLGVFVALTYGLGFGIEGAYRQYLKGKSVTLPESTLRHQLFTLFAFSAFTCLYFLGVRPTLGWLQPFRPLVDWGLVVAIALWCYRTLGRSADQYQRESVSHSLRRQLAKFGPDLDRVLGGRSLSDLRTDEVYVLAKVLPGFNHQKSLQIYREVLREALENGTVNSVSSLVVLQGLRNQLGISDTEHQQLLQDVGINDPGLLSPEKAASREQRLRLRGYRQSIEGLFLEGVQGGIPLNEMITQKQDALQALKQEYNINPEEEATVLAELLNQNSIFYKSGEKLLQQLHLLHQQRQILRQSSPLTAPVYDFLIHFLDGQQQMVSQQFLGILEILGNTPEAMNLAQAVGSQLPDDPLFQSALLRHSPAMPPWRDRLSPAIFNQLQRLQTETRVRLEESGSAKQGKTLGVLTDLLQSPEALIRAASLWAIAQIDAKAGKQYAAQLGQAPARTLDIDNIVADTAQGILGKSTPTAQPIENLEITIDHVQTTQVQFWHQTRITIGRDPGNDVVIPDSRVSRNHAVLDISTQGVHLQDLGSVNGLVYQNKVIHKETIPLKSGDRIGFSRSGSPAIVVSWQTSRDTAMGLSTLEKALWLAHAPLFRDIPHLDLLELALASQVRGYHPGNSLCIIGDTADEVLLLVRGSADVQVGTTSSLVRLGTITPGQTLGELAVLTQGNRTATVVATAESTYVLAIPAASFRALLDSHLDMTRQVLTLVSDRLQQTLNQLSA